MNTVMKTLGITVFMGFWLHFSLHAADVVTVTAKGPPLAVQAGQTATLLYAAFPGSAGLHVVFSDGTAADLYSGQLTYPSATASAGPLQPLAIAGPCTIGFTSNKDNNFATFKLAPANLDLPSMPTGAVVIPADGGGNYRVALESSSDLVTWTETTAGTFGSGAANRFFRVKLVKVN